MTKIKALSAVIILSAAIAAPAFSQDAVIRGAVAAWDRSPGRITPGIAFKVPVTGRAPDRSCSGAWEGTDRGSAAWRHRSGRLEARS